MYALIQWLSDKTVSVVEKSLVIGDFKEHSTVSVQFKRKKYDGVILKISENKKWLESINVTKSGKLIPKVKEAVPSAVLSKKSQVRSELQLTNKAQKSVQKQRTEALLSLMDTSKEQSSVGSVEDYDTDEIPNEEEKQRAGKATQRCEIIPDKQNKNEAAHGIGGDLGKGEHQEVQGIRGDLDPDENSKTTCPTCHDFPRGTAANVQFLNQVALYVSSLHERDLRTSLSSPKQHKDVNLQRELLTVSRSPSLNKVELYPGSGVFPCEDFLKDLQRDFKNSPKEMVRRLLKLLVGPSALKGMSAMGEGSFEAVPNDIRSAVQAWVGRKCSKDKVLTTYQFNRCINLMCGTLRSEGKKLLQSPRKKTSKRLSQHRPMTKSPLKTPEKFTQASMIKSPLKTPEKLTQGFIVSPMPKNPGHVIATSPWKITSHVDNSPSARRILPFGSERATIITTSTQPDLHQPTQPGSHQPLPTQPGSHQPLPTQPGSHQPLPTQPGSHQPGMFQAMNHPYPPPPGGYQPYEQYYQHYGPPTYQPYQYPPHPNFYDGNMNKVNEGEDKASDYHIQSI